MRSLLEMVVCMGQVIGEKSALDHCGIPKVKPDSQISAFFVHDRVFICQEGGEY